MNKQIDEMARDLCECYNCDGTCYQDDKPCDLKCDEYTNAQYLYEKGYRKQEWISVEERLPDIDGKYLVYTSKGFIFTQYYYFTNAFGFETWDVTHWMPLPEEPKMKVGAET